MWNFLGSKWRSFRKEEEVPLQSTKIFRQTKISANGGGVPVPQYIIWKIPWIWNGIQEQQGRQCANLCFSVPVLLCVTWSIFMSLSVSSPVNIKWYSRAAGAPMCQLRSLQDRSGCRIARTPGRKPNTCRRDKFWFWDLKEQDVDAFTNFVSFQNMLSF